MTSDYSRYIDENNVIHVIYYGRKIRAFHIMHVTFFYLIYLIKINSAKK